MNLSMKLFHPLIGAVVAAVLVSQMAAQAAENDSNGEGDGKQAPSHSSWFHEVSSPAVVASSTGAALCRWISDELRTSKSTGTLPKVPNDRSDDSVVVVSWSDGTGLPAVRIGAGDGIAAAVADAVARHRRSGESPQTDNLRVSLDIVQDIWQHPGFRIRQTEFPAPGVCGLAFSPNSGLAFLAGELIAVDAVGEDRTLRTDRIELLLARRSQWRKLGRWNIIANYIEPQPVCFFESQSFFMHDNSVSYVFRGHRMLQPLKPAELKQRTAAGAEFILQTLQREPRDLLVRELVRPDDAPPKPELTLADWAGCTLALAEYEGSAPEEVPASLSRALHNRLLEYAVEPPDIPESMLCLAGDGGVIRSGTNALVALALLETGAKADLRHAERIGRYLAAQAVPDLPFVVRRNADNGQAAAKTSVTESAQIIVALLRLYEKTSEPQFREIALNALDTLLENHVEQQEMDDLPRTPWVLEALNLGYTYSHNQRRSYRQNAERIALAVVADQTLKPSVPDELYSPRNSPSATQAAMDAHLLSIAADILRSARRTQSLGEIHSAMHAYLMFQLQAQMDAAAVFHLENPKTYEGAFRDDSVVVRFRPVDLWVQLRALTAVRRELTRADAEFPDNEQLPLTKSQKKALIQAYRTLITFPRALPE
ncbi:MAG: hypothetical protein ACOCUY_02025 [Verrucomicrobiota bacterium]